MTTSAPTSIERFDRTERNVHWWTAALVGTCLLTAAALYFPAVSVLVGRRGLVRDVHVVSGLALPVPYLVARLGRWRTALRADVRRLNRWDAMDRRWLASLGRDPFVRNAKFNAGQKLNAAFDVGAVALLLVTGAIMRWFGPFPLNWRTGATFVHDWTAFALLLVLVGHVGKALADRQALGAMVRGDVPVRWAERHAPRWLEEPRP
ncbi:MAG TPA: cytochrome b/b6 domain-containing protein [Acidimicrobiales bacterium]|nr:cytochrome b/b6 domain-containing protein [Acidimicrobiales bacterium]